MTIMKRAQQGLFEALAVTNRFAGSASGSALKTAISSFGGYAAGSAGAGWSTANSSTFADLTNTPFSVVVTSTGPFLYFFGVTAHITSGAGSAFFRGSIVGYDNTASIFVNSTTFSNGFWWYAPLTKGPIQPNTYTVKLQVSTDAGTIVTNDQFFHQFILLGQ